MFLFIPGSNCAEGSLVALAINSAVSRSTLSPLHIAAATNQFLEFGSYMPLQREFANATGLLLLEGRKEPSLLILELSKSLFDPFPSKQPH